MLPAPSTDAGTGGAPRRTWAAWTASAASSLPFSLSGRRSPWRGGRGGSTLDAPAGGAHPRIRYARLAFSSRSSSGSPSRRYTASPSSSAAAHSPHRQQGGSGGGPSASLALNRKTILFVVTCLLWYACSALNNNISQALLKAKGTKHAHPASGAIVPPNLDAHHAAAAAAGAGAHDAQAGKAGGSAPAQALFPYPLTLTLVQFVFVNIGAWICCSPTLLGPRRLGTLVRPTWAKVWQVGQLSVFNVVGHLFAAAAIRRVPVSTVQTIKAISPLITVVAYSTLFRVSYPLKTYLSLLPLTLGVMLACTGFNLSGDDVLGFSAALASTLVVVAQNIYSKKLMGGAGGHGEGKMDKLNILFVSSATSITLLLPSFLFRELPKMLRGRDASSTTATATATGSSSDVAYILYLLLVNGISHFAQNVFAFSVLGLVSPVTYSIASLFKRVFVIIVAIVWFGQAVTLLQWLGIAFTFVGLYLYNESKPGKVDEKFERREREEAMYLPLPGERERAEAELRAAAGLGSSLPPGAGTSRYPPAWTANGHANQALQAVSASASASFSSSQPQHSEPTLSARHRMLLNHPGVGSPSPSPVPILAGSSTVPDWTTAMGRSTTTTTTKVGTGTGTGNPGASGPGRPVQDAAPLAAAAAGDQGPASAPATAPTVVPPSASARASQGAPITNSSWLPTPPESTKGALDSEGD